MSGWLYFGCLQRTGHYLVDEQGRSLSRGVLQGLTRLDGMLPPRNGGLGYIASFSRLGGWGHSALAWWDYSVDNRPGSNSVIYAPDLLIDRTAMLNEAAQRFPWVFSRLPQPVVLQVNAREAQP